MNQDAPHFEPHTKIGGILKEAVFGFNDGLVSTFAIIAGLAGGAVENQTILLAALATLFAGSFSMGLGTYLGSKAEKEHYESERKREIYEMEHVPEVEKQEIRDIYAEKGFKGELLEKIVAHITKDDKLWLETMMREELGFAEAPPKPGLNGVVMSAAFFVGALLPALPYIFPGRTPEKFFVLSIAFSAVALVFAGAFKTRFTKRNIFLSSLETLAIGAFAAVGTYWIGLLIGG